MSDRLGRERELPVGYQFGDAGKSMSIRNVYERNFEAARMRLGDTVSVRIPGSWRAPHENAAERLVANSDSQWNRREGGMHS